MAVSLSKLSYELLYQAGAFSMLRVALKKGQTIKAQSDAMVCMDSTLDVKGNMSGGVLGALGRMFSGESFFFQLVTATRGDGEACFAPECPGDIIDLEMDGTPFLVQKGGFFAATEGVEISTTCQNLTRGLFSGEGFFVLRAQGKGVLFLESFGAIHVISLPPGKEIIIDNKHLVAWPEQMNYNIEKASASGWISSFTSGEGLVCRFRGPGNIMIQTRNPQVFGQWMNPLLPARG